MRILISSIQVPFIKGGSQLMTEGLRDALLRAGHQVEILTMPFKFFPESEVLKATEGWLKQDLNQFNGYTIDRLISLQFPAFYANHENKTLWLMHQHRAVYELYDEKNASKDLKKLKNEIKKYDDKILPSFKKRYAMSKTVAERAKRYNGIDSVVLYHPPFNEERFYNKEPFNYLFFPSRLEELKRQYLLIEAMRYVKTPVKAIIAGEGGQKVRYQKMIEEYDLKERVSLIGEITEEEKYTLYARSLGVFFTPYDEDYGYVTLEAMLSCKPVITCKDSGGVLEFVEDGTNGFVLSNSPFELAEKIDFLYENRKKAKEMGRAGYEIYFQKNISWDNVVSKLAD